MSGRLIYHNIISQQAEISKDYISLDSEETWQTQQEKATSLIVYSVQLLNIDCISQNLINKVNSLNV